MHIYLDESGDLGWSFDAPYRKGGSSRHLTIASLVVSSDKRHLTKRLIRNLYKRFKWSPKIEMKWAHMSREARVYFARQANSLVNRYPNDIRYLSITVKKQSVAAHIRGDANKLYNYMIAVSLLNEMAKHRSIQFVPDPRSVKVKSGDSLHDYLQTQLWFERKVDTKLVTTPIDSSHSLNVQFADMLSGAVQGYFEDGCSAPWEVLGGSILAERLFF